MSRWAWDEAKECRQEAAACCRKWFLRVLAPLLLSPAMLLVDAAPVLAEPSPMVQDTSVRTPASPRLERIRELIPEWQRQCINIDDGRPVTKEQRALHASIETLRQSEMGSWLIRQAAHRSVLVCHDGYTYLEAYYRAHLLMIGLNTKLDAAGRLVFLAHELAHVTQHPHFSNNRRFSPQDMLLLHRIREATAEAVATRILWQLRDLGHEAGWAAKLNTAYGDIAQTFAATMADNTAADAELQASRSAFYHWFEAAWRRDIYDDLMLKTLSRIAGDHIGILPASRQLSDGYLLEISRYAGRRFLEKGDGWNLINDFNSHWLTSGHQARLDDILGHRQVSAVNANEQISIVDRTGLSASSLGPNPLEHGN